MIRARGFLSSLLIAAALAATAAGPARAVVPAGNLLVNGDAESGTGASDVTTISPVPIPGWVTTSDFTEHTYGQPGTTNGFPDTKQSGALGGGAQFFTGGPYTGAQVETATQDVDVSAAAPEIDRGGVNAKLFADVGGPDDNGSSGTVTATFLSAGSSPLGHITVGPAPTQGQSGVFDFAPITAAAVIPPGTRTIRVVMTATHPGSSSSFPYDNAVFDNLSLTLAGPPPLPPPPAPPVKTATPAPPVKTATPAPPVLGKSVDAGTVSGAVRLRLPGKKAFTKLTTGRIPLGSTIDATNGVVTISSAKDRRGRTTKGRFFGGEFRVTQVPARGRELTVLTLVEPRRPACGVELRAVIMRARRAPKPPSLWGTASGGFRTVGRYGSATERGTTWLTQDTCAGTLIRVTRDAVTVDDFAQHRTLVVRAPHAFLARPGRVADRDALASNPASLRS